MNLRKFTAAAAMLLGVTVPAMADTYAWSIQNDPAAQFQLPLSVGGSGTLTTAFNPAYGWYEVDSITGTFDLTNTDTQQSRDGAVTLPTSYPPLHVNLYGNHLFFPSPAGPVTQSGSVFEFVSDGVLFDLAYTVYPQNSNCGRLPGWCLFYTLDGLYEVGIPVVTNFTGLDSGPGGQPIGVPEPHPLAALAAGVALLVRPGQIYPRGVGRAAFAPSRSSNPA
jgi:hypothetical protein